MAVNLEAPSNAHDSAQSRQRPTLELLAQQYAHALTQFFMRRVHNKSEVADLVQDVFLRLARLKDLSSIEQTSHYIFATAASALRDERRRALVRKRQSHDSFQEELHAPSDLSPERVVDGRHAVDRLQFAIRELPERTRDIFILRIFEALKVAEIARMLGISQRAVEKHHAKAMVHITARLSGFREE